MLKSLSTLFPHLLGTTGGPTVDFYNKFQREADDYDSDFVKKYDEDLNTTLIFVSPPLILLSRNVNGPPILGR